MTTDHDANYDADYALGLKLQAEAIAAELVRRERLAICHAIEEEARIAYKKTLRAYRHAIETGVDLEEARAAEEQAYADLGIAMMNSRRIERGAA